MRTKKNGELYQTSSFKVLQAGLNRWFKVNKHLDIVADSRFGHVNLVFDSVQEKAKKSGKGVTKSTIVISNNDLIKISSYFQVDHTRCPNPKVLQQTVLFYILYYFCRRRQENLYSMKQNTFEIEVEPDGTRYIYQAVDEKDKNHSSKDMSPTNQARMYEDPGN